MPFILIRDGFQATKYRTDVKTFFQLVVSSAYPHNSSECKVGKFYVQIRGKLRFE